MAALRPHIHQRIFRSKLAGNGGDAECVRPVEEKRCRPSNLKPAFALEFNALPVEWAALAPRYVTRGYRRASWFAGRILDRLNT